VGWRVGVFVVGATLLVTLPFRWTNPPTSSIILQRHWLAYSEDRPGPRQRWRDAKEISPHLAVAVLASEDQKFPDHFGFDFKSIGDAVRARSDRPRGASTITQQVAKNLYLWPGRSFVRKGIEAYLTLVIEALWPKDRILEIYLNIAEFGPDLFGAEIASRVQFGKPALRLSRYEAALLAAVLPNPALLSARNPSALVRERAQAISQEASRMGRSGVLRDL
jgi:monofunctional biosynthetic peptidoglycan transglycosylase